LAGEAYLSHVHSRALDCGYAKFREHTFQALGWIKAFGSPT
jgi:hypothetical protein